MRTDILSERRRWGELLSQNWVETVGQLTEDVQTSQGDPRHQQKTDEIYVKLETLYLFKIKDTSMGRDVKRKELFDIFLIRWEMSSD